MSIESNKDSVRRLLTNRDKIAGLPDSTIRKRYSANCAYTDQNRVCSTHSKRFKINADARKLVKKRFASAGVSESRRLSLAT